MLKLTHANFAAMIKGTSDNATRALLENLQKSLEYCIEENDILRETLKEKLDGMRLRLNQEQRKRLSAKAIRLDRRILQDVTHIFQPATILGWYSKDGFLNGQKNLTHDCDTLFTDKFKKLMTGSGITTKKTRPHCPNMNAYIERFIQSIEVECLDKLILTNEDQLRYVVKEYLEYYNHERPHQGLDGQFIDPLSQDDDGEIREFSLLGCLLKSYRRVSTKNLAYFYSNKLLKQDKHA